MDELIRRLRAALGDRYDIRGEVGHGGTAIVVGADDLRHGRRVAIKVLRPELAVSGGRFLHEIKTVAQLQHPLILPLYDSGCADELLYFVMPWVEGDSLARRIERQGQLPVDEALRITSEVADALSFAHSRGFIHRDIKPANILLTAQHAVLSDFGIARAIEHAVDDAVTASGLALGTPLYMSPEQAAGDKHLDGRTDEYGLACVLFEMLAGTPPFSGASTRALIAQRFRSEVPHLRTRRPSVPPHIDEAITRALAPNPADRFASVAAFSEALRGSGRRPMLPARRRWIWTTVGLALACATIIFVTRIDRNSLWPAVMQGEPRLDPSRLAVLYFDDNSPNHDLGYLANGLTESLIDELSRVGAIHVISRNGVKPYRDRSASIDSLVASLRVGSVVEGSVQRSANRVRVTVTLIDAQSKTHLENTTLERPMGELFALEDDLGHQVATMLRKRLGMEVRLRKAIAGTTSNSARELTLKGEAAREAAATAIAIGDSLSAHDALHLLLRADSLLAAAQQADRRWIRPIVARGWVALDMAMLERGERHVSALQRGFQYARIASRLDSTDAAALELRGTLAWRLATTTPAPPSQMELLRVSEQSLRAAVGADSSLASAWSTLGRLLRLKGEFAEADIASQQALAADAYLSDAPEILNQLYRSELMSGHLDKALTLCQRARHDFPADWRFIECRLTLLREQTARAPDTRTAWSLVRELDRVDPPSKARSAGRPYSPIYRMMVAAAISARAGDVDSARAVAARARSLATDDELQVDLDYDEAYLRLALGETTKALDLLSHYVRAKPHLKRFIARDAKFSPLFSSRRFVEILR